MYLRTSVQQLQSIVAKPPFEEGSDTLVSVRRLFNAFNNQDIRYCHWKSNLRLDWGLAGRTDLDLLIDPADRQAFKRILAYQKIKPLLAPAAKQYPGLEHYLGLDEQTGKLFHLHVHFKLVLGEQFVKNYSLPIEKQFFNATRFNYGVRIPTPELELIVLTLRALLKYRDRDVIKDFFNIRSPGIPNHILKEIKWLSNQTSLEQIEETLKAIPQVLKAEIVLKFLETIQVNPRNGRVLFQLRSKIRKILRPYQRSSRLLASLSYFKQLAQKMLIQRSKPDRQLLLPTGGLMVAFVGVDGSGKSTLSSALTQWLSWKVDTPFYYLGSKQPSAWTNWSYILFRMARRGHRELSSVLGKNNFIVKLILNARQIFLSSHYLSVGRDRYGRYRLAKRAAANGSIVIFDRFPFVAPLDGPEIHLIDNGLINSVCRYLSRLEQNLYKKFEPVDMLILLNVDPEISLQRKPDHSSETIRVKNSALDAVKTCLTRESEKWNWVSIDANAPYDKVLLHIKTLIWTAI